MAETEARQINIEITIPPINQNNSRVRITKKLRIMMSNFFM